MDQENDEPVKAGLSLQPQKPTKLAKITMSDDESAAVGPSPAKSIAVSVASTMASRKSTKESAVQAKVAAMSRAELEDGMLKLLSKLQAKEKQIKGDCHPAMHSYI